MPEAAEMDEARMKELWEEFKKMAPKVPITFTSDAGPLAEWEDRAAFVELYSHEKPRSLDCPIQGLQSDAVHHAQMHLYKTRFASSGTEWPRMHNIPMPQTPEGDRFREFVREWRKTWPGIDEFFSDIDHEQLELRSIAQKLEDDMSQTNQKPTLRALAIKLGVLSNEDEMMFVYRPDELKDLIRPKVPNIDNMTYDEIVDLWRKP